MGRRNGLNRLDRELFVNDLKHEVTRARERHEDARTRLQRARCAVHEAQAAFDVTSRTYGDVA